MLTELALRFIVGGLVVSVFALLGEIWRPRSFAGLFGAAPSVALVTIGLAFAKHGPSYVTRTSTTMIAGAAAMAVYCTVCATVLQSRALPAWAQAGLAWISWLAAAGLIHLALAAGGIA